MWAATGAVTHKTLCERNSALKGQVKMMTVIAIVSLLFKTL